MGERRNGSLPPFARILRGVASSPWKFALFGLGVGVACQPTTPIPGASSPPASLDAGASVVDASASVDASRPSSIALGLTNVFPGTLAIENTGDVPVRLSSTPVIESLDRTGTFTKVAGLDLEGLPGKGMRLVESCADPPVECVEIAPHHVFHPVRFTGMSCSSQCNGTCRANTNLSGRFRWVLTPCGGGAPLMSPMFELPPEIDQLGREGLATDLVSGAVMRLESPPVHWAPEKPATPGTIVGVPVRPATERPIDPADLATFVTWLRDPKSFDDHIEKRCAKSTFVGFRFTRRPASTIPAHDETAEALVDLSCNSLFIVHDGEGPTHTRVVFATYFDPSRAAFVALLKKLLPHDGELATKK